MIENFTLLVAENRHVLIACLIGSIVGSKSERKKKFTTKLLEIKARFCKILILFCLGFYGSHFVGGYLGIDIKDIKFSALVAIITVISLDFVQIIKKLLPSLIKNKLDNVINN